MLPAGAAHGRRCPHRRPHRAGRANFSRLMTDASASAGTLVAGDHPADFLPALPARVKQTGCLSAVRPRAPGRSRQKRAGFGRTSISPARPTRRASPGGKLFPWASRHSVYKWLRPLARNLKLTYTPHMSRHAMASDLYAEGSDVARIRERGLWRDDRSVRRYVQRADLAAPVRGAGRVVNKR